MVDRPRLPRPLGVLWALPVTLVGIAFVIAGLLTGGRMAFVDGAIEAHGGIIRRALGRVPVGGGGAGALTLGHVVLGTNARQLEVSRSHERVHVMQYERWGLAYPLAYASSSLSAILRGQNAYRGNRFEKEANRLAKLRRRPGKAKHARRRRAVAG
jgi:hypothetical protein